MNTAALGSKGTLGIVPMGSRENPEPIRIVHIPIAVEENQHAEYT